MGSWSGSPGYHAVPSVEEPYDRSVCQTPLSAAGRSTDQPRKTIGWLYSISLLSNNIFGVGIVAFPYIFQKAGWLPTLVVYLFAFFADAFCANFMCEAISRVRNNIGFRRDIQYADVVLHYFGTTWYLITLTLFSISLIAQSIACIILSAQVTDGLIITLFHHSHAVDIGTHGFKWLAFAGMGAFPQDVGGFAITVGFLVIFAMCAPWSFFCNLGEGWALQMFAFGIIISVLFEFIITYFGLPMSSANMPTVGPDLTRLVGVCLFSYAFVVTIPSWVAEKKPNVDIFKVVWGCMILVTAIHIIFGVLGALTHAGLSGDVLAVLTDGGGPHTAWITRVMLILLNFGIIMPDIPVYAVMVRYNLQHVLPAWLAFFISTILPWIIAIWLQRGQGFINVVSWAGAYNSSVLEFIVPSLVYIKAVSTAQETATLDDTTTDHIDPLLEDEARGERRAKDEVEEEKDAGLADRAWGRAKAVISDISDEGGELETELYSAVPSTWNKKGLAIGICAVSTCLLLFCIVQDIYAVVAEGKNLLS